MVGERGSGRGGKGRGDDPKEQTKGQVSVKSSVGSNLWNWLILAQPACVVCNESFASLI